jgi:hypothetical protein
MAGAGGAGARAQVQARVRTGVAAGVRREERRLLGGLVVLALGSIGAGVAARRAVRARGATGPFADVVTGVARQAVGWGLVDLAIAGWGVRGLLRARGERSGEDDEAAAARARRLARITGANAVADVGYVVAGAVLAARSPARRGDGLGIAVQGLALLRLDVTHAWAFRGLSSGVRGRSVGART